ncbi:ATP-binding protein [Acetobacter oeni]|uniref:histidine kinase n=1 Tax=Acetobacter oeni TaxID=304077 RepID=A0A511XH63_9PROT|nr:ATP-binding protein [Acetobacter oeni]MBB3882421.1 two-component system sensor histidine kinase RpfC [Acetobacter oeni]NHO18483.1 response regulator [Acetobacter oeni]GBR00472.1 signal transduction histidine kinase [Acetobacter oeni LMG 21952]GEN62278.1 hybrid sensor histidine kinase/response regulator [Acetobacter oeni]
MIDAGLLSAATPSLSRLTRSEDGEHQVVLNRISITLLSTCYVLLIYLLGNSSPQEALFQAKLCGVALAVSFLFGGAVWLAPSPSIPRRMTQFLWDLGFLTFVVCTCGAPATPLYPIFLWTTLGYGFRFGAGYLVAGSILSASGFLFASQSLPMWNGTDHLLGGLVIGLLIIPFYAASLTRFVSTMRLKAEESSRAKTFFVATVSHELRIPLNAILGLGPILKSGPLNSEQLDMVSIIHEAGLSLLNTINGLLEFSRLEDGRMPVRTQPFAVMASVRHVIGMLHVEARRKGLTLTCAVSPSVPPWANGDKHHLEDILRNIVSNAVKFTIHGSVTVALDGKEKPDGTTELHVTVRDTGIGIPPSAIAHIFDSFTQADGTVPARFGGTGLGLAICRKLVDLHGGRLTAESTPGEGSRFQFTYDVEKITGPENRKWPPIIFLTRSHEQRKTLFRQLRGMNLFVEVVQTVEEAGAQLRQLNGRAILATDPSSSALAVHICKDRLRTVPVLLPHLTFVGPVRNEETHPGKTGDMALCEVSLTDHPDRIRAALTLLTHIMPDHSELRQPVMKNDGRKYKVLIAEDYLVSFMVAAKILEQAGHEWVSVSNGDAALDALEHEPFDLVLMDVNMPLRNGIETTRMWRLREAADGQHTPIIALTADASPLIRERCHEAGMDAFLLKPVDAGQLLDLLDLYGSAKTEPDMSAKDPAPDAPPARDAVVVALPGSGVNRKAMQDLDTLGGAAFRADVVAEFLQDAGITVGQMKAACEAEDMDGLPDAAHALKSAAANVGADRLMALCRRWGAPDSPARPADRIRAVEEELARVRTALLPYLEETGEEA